MKKTETTYNPETDLQLAFPTDTPFKAHIREVDINEYKPGRYIFKLKGRVSEENEGSMAQMIVLRDSGNGRVTEIMEGRQIDLGKEFAGRVIDVKPIFFDIEPDKPYFNETYFAQFSALGIEFRQNKDGSYFMDLVENADLFGLPFIGKTEVVNQRNKKTNTSYRQMLITGMMKWEGGERQDADGFAALDDLPF